MKASKPKARGTAIRSSRTSGHGYPRTTLRTTISLAEGLRRTVIGTIRRECLGHVIIFHEGALRRNLYLDYDHRSRTHLALGQDALERRPVQPPTIGSVIAVPQVGGLHHRYERRAA